MGILIIITLAVILSRCMFFGDGNFIENLFMIFFGKGILLIVALIILSIAGLIFGF